MCARSMPERRIRIRRWNARVHGLRAVRLTSIAAEDRRRTTALRAMIAGKAMTVDNITIVHRIMIVAGLRTETVWEPYTTLRLTCGKVRLRVAMKEISPDATIRAAMQTTGTTIEATRVTRIRAVQKSSALRR